MKYIDFFRRRTNTFQQAFLLIQKQMTISQNNNIVYNIVELGTSRSFVDGNVNGCCSPDSSFWQPENPCSWDWGAGVFTKVFSDNLKGEQFKLYTIDPNDTAISIVTTMCKDNKEVQIIKDYSTTFLSSIDFKIDFLYMDHMESGEEACIKHLEDSKLIVERNLINENGIILIDDVGVNITETKGKYSIPFLLENGFEKVLHEYQVLLTKTKTKTKTKKHIL